MAKLGSIKSDLEKERSGVWKTYRDSDLQCLIARAGTPEYQREARRFKHDARVKAAQAGDGGNLTPQEMKEAIAPAVARFVLLGWRNLQDDEGNEVPYSPQKAVELLRKPELHDWYDWILAESNDQDSFRLEVEEAAAGN